MGNDLLISLLRFGASRVPEGVTYGEAYQFLQSEGYLSKEEFTDITKVKGERSEAAALKKRRVDWFFEQAFPARLNNDPTGQRYMTLDNYFHLVEHQELTEARQNATSAKKQAQIAIVISMFTILASVGVAYYQSSQAIHLDDQQMGQLLRAMHKPQESGPTVRPGGLPQVGTSAGQGVKASQVGH